MMTKHELYRHFQDHMGEHGVKLTRDQAREFFEELERTASAELVENGEFTIPGVAKLKVTDKRARTGRNPSTGERIEIQAKRVVKARIPKRLQDMFAEAA